MNWPILKWCFILYSTDIPHTALIKDLVWVNTMSKSPEATNCPRSLASAWQSFMSCRCIVDCLPQYELWDFYLFSPTHRGRSSSHEKKVLHCPGESLAVESLPGRSELTSDREEPPGKSLGWIWASGIYGHGQTRQTQSGAAFHMVPCARDKPGSAL